MWDGHGPSSCLIPHALWNETGSAIVLLGLSAIVYCGDSKCSNDRATLRNSNHVKPLDFDNQKESLSEAKYRRSFRWFRAMAFLGLISLLEEVSV